MRHGGACLPGWISSAAAFVLGDHALIFKPKFVELITFIFGVVILFGLCSRYFSLCSVPVRPDCPTGFLLRLSFLWRRLSMCSSRLRLSMITR